MLSKKMAVSLAHLITMLALGLIAPAAIAANFQLTVEGPTSVSYAEGDTLTEPLNPIRLTLTSPHPLPNDLKFGTHVAYKKDGFPVPDASKHVVVNDPVYPGRTSTKRQLSVTITPQASNGDVAVRVLVVIDSMETTDLTVPAADDASDIVYHYIDIMKEPSENPDRPKVVSIQRLGPGSQAVDSIFEEAIVANEPFYVRVVLTEARPGLDADADTAAEQLVEVENGKASALVVGKPFKREGTLSLPTDGTPPTLDVLKSTYRPHPREGRYDNSFGGNAWPGADNMTIPLPSGTDNMYHPYRVLITPDKVLLHRYNPDDPPSFPVNIHVELFHDGGSPYRHTYIPLNIENKPNGREQLRLQVAKVPVNPLKAGYRVVLPAGIYLPANGYLVIAAWSGDAQIDVPPEPLKAPNATQRTPAQMRYNVYRTWSLPNLATDLIKGVVVDVESQHPNLVISEVMWGENRSLQQPKDNQWIELYNPGRAYITKNDNPLTPTVNEALTLIFYRAHEFHYIPAAGAYGTLPTGITDRIGTLDANGRYWNILGTGQGGATNDVINPLEGIPPNTDGDFDVERLSSVQLSHITPVISMYRVIDANGNVADGQLKSAWRQSKPPSANFNPNITPGTRIGTPGAATHAVYTEADTQAKADKAQADADKIATTGAYPMLGEGRVYISEIMFAGGGILPQWIEIANADPTKDFNLSGWTLTVDNAAADTEVSIGASATFTIPNGTTIGASKVHDPAGDNMPSTLLIVTEPGRNSFSRPKEAKQIINLAVDNEVELITAGVLTRRWTLLSDEAFLITLEPPVPKATKAPVGETAAAKTKRLADERKEDTLRTAATDIVGNLAPDGTAAWTLPTREAGARSSIIRRHVPVFRGPKVPEDGIYMENWTLAADTAFADALHSVVKESYYGAANDVGTPGFRSGGALPVELSHFRPVRDKATGTVVITWATQSELNNAGFFIKRSNQPDGEFKVINVTMVPGAGTTSDKQFYTYTDTTAQPNVVYYYQIEDVSLDGNHQTLTRRIRLKGHIGAAGKATVIWGALKASTE